MFFLVPAFGARHQTGSKPAWQEPHETCKGRMHNCLRPALSYRLVAVTYFRYKPRIQQSVRPLGSGGTFRMAEKLVGKISEFKDGDRRIVFVGDHEIGVFWEHGTFYAYSNYCLHQGGPACEGLTIAKVEERIMPDKTSKGLYFSDTELHFVCPWHGYEYDIKTGECVSDRKLKLRKYEVIQKGDEVYVRA
jgi:nitrite reductase/ring-hydroxylating ferredoxin subunit